MSKISYKRLILLALTILLVTGLVLSGCAGTESVAPPVTFRDELDKLDKNKTYLIYFRSGVHSGNARDIMEELNFREVYNILGGFNRWQAEGLAWAS